MTGNVVQFPARSAAAHSTIEATAAASISSVIQYRPARRSFMVETLAKEEKQLIALDIMRAIDESMAAGDASANISLKVQRVARYEAWGKASSEAGFRKALNDFQLALHVAQRNKMPEALLYDPIEIGSASWHATIHAYQDATDRQLLSRARNSLASRATELRKQ